MAWVMVFLVSKTLALLFWLTRDLTLLRADLTLVSSDGEETHMVRGWER